MKCSICGKEIEKSSYLNAILCSDECFYENFWRDRLSDPTTIIMDGNAYYVGDEDSKSSFRGFGGAAWYIRKNDGTSFKSTNLWHNGKIPEKYNAKDNAKQITQYDYDYLRGILTKDEWLGKPSRIREVANA